MDRIVTVLLALAMAACAQPPPSPLPEAGPTLEPAVAVLRLDATVSESCGAIGGCAYAAELEGPDGRSRRALSRLSDGRLTLDKPGTWATLPMGQYTLILGSAFRSDAVDRRTGVRDVGAVNAMCSVGFTIVPGVKTLDAHVDFRTDDRTVRLVSSAHPAGPGVA